MDNYELCGIINWFQIIPNFVSPVFIKDNNYYVMNMNEETKQTYFTIIQNTHLDKIVLLHELAGSYLNIKNKYNEEDEIIGAFQLDDSEVVIGQLDLLISMLNNYTTDNKILAKEIIDYINEAKYYIDFKNSKKSR